MPTTRALGCAGSEGNGPGRLRNGSFAPSWEHLPMRLPTLFLACFALLFSPMQADPKKTDTVVLAGGCFWCVEAAYRLLPGVVAVTSGYTGGQKAHPTYQEVCSGTTGHAEATRIEYDPAVLPLEKLLAFFWKVHDPTTLNRQGADEGTQYRSAIFYRSVEQKLAAEKSRTAAQAGFASPIVTEIVPLAEFWPAEDYHQNYLPNNPDNRYCQLVVRPKIEKLKKVLAEEAKTPGK